MCDNPLKNWQLNTVRGLLIPSCALCPHSQMRHRCSQVGKLQKTHSSSDDLPVAEDSSPDPRFNQISLFQDVFLLWTACNHAVMICDDLPQGH